MSNLLIELAKKSILESLTGEFNIDKPYFLQESKEYDLTEQRATFVTLNLNGCLRGCIGSLVAHRTLFDDIVSNAKSAAFEDPRFPSLTIDEFENIEIEISILTPPQLLNYSSVEDLKSKITPHEDGVILKHNGRQSTFLPLVWEQLPTFEEFFEHLSYKAGLTPNCLEELPEIYIYHAELNVEQASSLLIKNNKSKKDRQDACPTLIPFDYGNPIDITERHLPHWQQEETTYFITFRLADAIPKKIMEKIQNDRIMWKQIHTEPYSEKEWIEYNKLFSEKINNLLDAGNGACVLKNMKIYNIVKNALLHFDEERYNLGEWVIMPNHVHLLVTPKKGFTINDIIHSWKSFTANKVNEMLNRTGALWQDESYDHIIRNNKQLKAVEKYIIGNPIKM